MTQKLATSIFLLIVMCSAAYSQGCGQNNPNCIVSTAPPGTNNNQAASTAFVQQAVTNNFANPSASVGLSAVNGSASTAMRSDAAPPLSSSVQSALTGTNAYLLQGTGSFGYSAVQYCTLTQGCLGGSQAAATANQVPVYPGAGGAAVPTTITPAIIGSLFANPTASAGPNAINGAATTAMRSDASPPVQKGSSSQFGIMECDNTTVTCPGGVLSSVGGGAASVWYTLSHATGAWVCSDGSGATFNIPSGTANTHSNTTVDNLSINANLLTPGEVIAGSGITGGTTIVSINSSTSITISAVTSTSLTATAVTFSSTSSGANECMKGAVVNNANFRALCQSATGGVPITVTGRLQFPPTTGTVFNLDGCYANLTGDIGVQVDTLANGAAIEWRGGELFCNLTGGKFACIDFIPTVAANGTTTIGPVIVEFPMLEGVCSASGAIGAGVKFDTSGGSLSSNTAIYGSKFSFSFIDGFDGTHNCFADGILVTNPANVNGAFAQNYIYAGYIQGFSAWGILNGTSIITIGTQALATNQWDIGSIGSAQDGASVSPTGGGIQTFGFEDRWSANVSLNSGSLPVGFKFGATTARGNFFVIPQLTGTTPMVDNGTTLFNAGYCNGKVNFSGSGSASC